MPKTILPWEAEVSPDEFIAWMKRHKLSIRATADAFGLSRNTIARYRATGCPKWIRLACLGYEIRYLTHRNVEKE